MNRLTPKLIQKATGKITELKTSLGFGESAGGLEERENVTVAEKIDGLLIQITQKTGAEGKLFGSVTNANIVEALQAQGFSVDKSMVSMPQGPLKQVGDHPITIVLHSDVSAHITVSILGEAVI